MAPSLRLYPQFEEALRNYSVSAEAIEDLEDLKLVLLLGPTSSGRNTIIRHLVGTGNYHYIVSDTTRPPRVNDGELEQNGREYWFRSEEEVLADIEAGDFLEAEIIHRQQVSGISIRELKKAKQEGKIAVTDIELEGVHNVMKVKPNTFAVMILPPSFEEWQKRLAHRGVMTPTEKSRRMETAYKIFQDGSVENYYH
jgi:guanylate kinase